MRGRKGLAACLGVLVGTIALVACGSSGTSGASPATATSVAGGTGCAADHRQNLDFSGAIEGHLACAEGQPICDFIAAGKTTEHYFTAAIHATAGGKPLLLSFAVAAFDGPGSYASDNIEGGTSITLDGATHWLTRIGDAIVVATADRQVLTGSLDSTLTDGSTGPIHLIGTWVCDRVSSGQP